jgi:ABC-type multidrug transport system fused ATPase/permease subunit
MERMDEILVLDDGRIVERYTYEELLKANSLKKRMVEVQTQMLITSWAYSKR